MEFKIRKEVLDYMLDLGNRLKSELGESELAYAKIMEDPLLIEKIRDVESNSLKAKLYYEEMEYFYDRYENPNTRISLSGARFQENIDLMFTDFTKLMGGAGVGWAIARKRKKFK